MKRGSWLLALGLLTSAPLWADSFYKDMYVGGDVSLWADGFYSAGSAGGTPQYEYDVDYVVSPKLGITFSPSSRLEYGYYVFQNYQGNNQACHTLSWIGHAKEFLNRLFKQEIALYPFIEIGLISPFGINEGAGLIYEVGQGDFVLSYRSIHMSPGIGGGSTSVDGGPFIGFRYHFDR